MKTIAAITGTRAEFGLLYPLLKILRDRDDFALKLLVTGTHLSEDHGLTKNEILEQGFSIDKEIPNLVDSDDSLGICLSMSKAMAGFAEELKKLAPDYLLLLGDRHEMLAVSQVALILQIPVIHLGGGDLTEGAYDNAIRHAISLLSHLHFPTNEQAKNLILQLGESPEYVHNVGSLGIDNVVNGEVLSKSELEQSLGTTLLERNILLTYHPATLGNEDFDQLLLALDRNEPDSLKIFTFPNHDLDSQAIVEKIKKYCDQHDRAICFPSLGNKRYLSLLREIDLVAGNSSSGIYEAPSFNIPTINIGDRQKGRMLASSVVQCQMDANDLDKAFSKAKELNCANTVNPYGDGKTAERIYKALLQQQDDRFIPKRFNSLAEQS